MKKSSTTLAQNTALIFSAKISCGRLTKLQSIHVLDSLLGFPALSFESRKLARNAMLAWRGSKAGFADAMIGPVAAELGAEFVLSFDKNVCAPGVASAAAVIGSAARDRREISSPLPSTSWTGPRGDYAGRRQKARPDPGFRPFPSSVAREQRAAQWSRVEKNPPG